MKLRIAYNKPPIEGYLQLDPIPREDSPAIATSLADLNLDIYCENNECTEILAPELLDYIPFHKVFNFLHMLHRKMRLGSRLIIGGTEPRLLARSIIDGELDQKQYNQIVYSDGKSGTVPCSDLCEMLKSVGLQVVSRKLDGVTYIVEACRA